MIFQYVKRLKAPIENILTIELSKGNKGKDRGHIHKVKRLSKQTKYCEISLVFLAHLSTKCSGWAIVTGLCPSTVVVRRASCVNFFT